jgi:hypothetical protein
LVVRRGADLLCLGLLLVMGANLLSVTARKSLTNDEIVHIPAAWAYLAAGNFRLNNEHPPLAKAWAALPLLLVGPVAPPAGPAKTPVRRTLDYAGRFWDANAARYGAIAFWPRAAMVLPALALGALIFGYARRLFGPRAALLAAALYSLEPTVLAHGRVVHTDLPAALAYLGCFAALDAYWRAPGPRRAGLLGLATGAALVTKFSLLVLLPALAVALGIALWLAPRRALRRPALAGHAVLVALLVLGCVNAAYGFRNVPLDEADVRWIASQSGRHADAVLGAHRLLSRVVPTDFLYGLFVLYRHNVEAQPAALLGQQRAMGFWYYFPVAFALKTSLPFLLLTLAALGWAARRFVRGRDGRFLAVLVPIALYTALAMTSRINIGVRHFLPTVPFLCILGGAALDRLLSSRGSRGALAGMAVAGMLAWAGGAAARAYPDYMSAMNELARRHPRWWYLSDSNVEWGDDVGDLARYLRDRGETRVRGALAGAWGTLRFHGVDYLDLVAPTGEPPPATRYVAIGASFLNGSTVPGSGSGERASAPGRRDYFAAYRGRRPEAVFGGSIYLYRMRAVPPADGPLPEGAYAAALTIVGPPPPATLRPGQTVALRVRVGNAAAVAWPRRGRDDGAYQVRLGDRWRDAGGNIARDDARAPLLDDLAPGDWQELSLTITAPTVPGEYALELDLVQEGVAWFGQRGSPPIRLRIRVDGALASAWSRPARGVGPRCGADRAGPARHRPCRRKPGQQTGGERRRTEGTEGEGRARQARAGESGMRCCRP